MLGFCDNSATKKKQGSKCLAFLFPIKAIVFTFYTSFFAFESTMKRMENKIKAMPIPICTVKGS